MSDKLCRNPSKGCDAIRAEAYAAGQRDKQAEIVEIVKEMEAEAEKHTEPCITGESRVQIYTDELTTRIERT